MTTDEARAIEQGPRAVLLWRLRNLRGGEVDHLEADQALIEYINDAEVAEAFEKVEKWYA